jgi:hypothetical protein
MEKQNTRSVTVNILFIRAEFISTQTVYMYRTVPLEQTSYKTVTGSSGETQVCAEEGGTADKQALKFSK